VRNEQGTTKNMGERETEPKTTKTKKIKTNNAELLQKRMRT
jgi:hypothetical protein